MKISTSISENSILIKSNEQTHYFNGVNKKKQKKYKDEQQYIRTAGGADLAEYPFTVVATTATDYNSMESPSTIGFIRPPSTVTSTLSTHNRWIRIRKHCEQPPPLHQIHFSAAMTPLR